MSKSSREITAIHEAAHAVVSELLRSGSVNAAAILAGSGGVHYDAIRGSDAEGLVSLAGAVGAKLAGGTGEAARMSASDEAGWKSYLSRSGLSHRRAREAQRLACTREVQQMLAANWGAVERVARALVERGALTGHEVRAIMAGKPERRELPQQPAGGTMGIAEMYELRALAQKRGQTRLVAALNRTLEDGPAEVETWTFPAEIRIEGGR